MCLYFCIPCTEVESGPGCSPETSEPPSEELPASPFLFPDYTWQIRSTMSPIGDFFPFKGQNMHLRVVQNKNVTLNSLVCSMIAAVLGTNYIFFPVSCHARTMFFPLLPSHSGHAYFVTALALGCRARMPGKGKGYQIW